MGIKIVEELKQLRSNTYEHGIPIEEHLCSRAIKAIEHMARGLDAQAAEIERLRDSFNLILTIECTSAEATLSQIHRIARKALIPQTED